MDNIKKQMKFNNLDEMAERIVEYMFDELPHTINEICEMIEEEYYGVEPSIVAWVMQQLEQEDDRVTKLSNNAYIYIHRPLKDISEESHVIMQDIYSEAKRHRDYLRRTILADPQAPNLILTLGKHMNICNDIIKCCEKKGNNSR